MVMHVHIGKTPHSIVMKMQIIVELLQVIQIMMEVHGVIYLQDGKDVTYQYVVVSKVNPI